MRFVYFAATILTAFLLTHCVSTDVTRLDSAPTGLEPVDTSEVAIYADTSSIECPYSAVAFLSSTGSVSGLDEKVTRKSKEKAAELGANTLIIGSMRAEGPSFFDRYGDTEGRFLAVYEERPCK